ncbi:hypothetical protein Hanom_Chr12g01072271 [Helianthus anomalus]
MGEDYFHLRGNLLTTFSALTMNEFVEEEDVLQQIKEQEQEIIKLRKHLAEYAVKEAHIQDEKRVLATRIGLMYKAIDQEEQDLVEATAKAIAYRQDIIEENIRVGYALQEAQEERSIFVSSLVPFLVDQSIHPAALDAVSVVSSLRILFKHNKERLNIAEEKLRDYAHYQYQPQILHPYRKEVSFKDSPQREWTHASFSPSPETVHMGVERRKNEEDVVNSHYLPSILEEEHEQDQEQEQEHSFSHQEDDYSDDDDDEYDDFNTNKPLPTIEGLQILGEPFPGNEIQASGYSKNGTTHCGFEWVRHSQDGSFIYIEGAKQSVYTVTADDVDHYLSIEVQPLDDKQMKGDVIRCFANDHKKITCHPDMIREIERTLTVGHASFKLDVWKGFSDTWEPAVLEINKSGYSVKFYGPNNGVVVDSKYTPKTVISIPEEAPLEFAIRGPGDVEQYLCADYDSADVCCSRDTIVLTMRLFVKLAVDKQLGKKKKKRRVLFFK